MNHIWLAQFVLLPVQVGWAALYWWSGRSVQHRAFDVLAVFIATVGWLGGALWVGALTLPDGSMWAVIASTTAGFLVFNLILACAAGLRARM